MKTKFFREPLTADEIKSHKLVNDDAPAIYVGTYGKYNDGSINGQWIDLTTFDDADELREYCERLHADEADPEIMVQDYMNFPESLYRESGLPTDEELDDIKEYAEMSEDEAEAFDAYCEIYGKKSVDDFRDAYCGYYRHPEDFAEETYRECYEIPEYLECYIDWANIWRDYELNGDYAENKGYIFRNY